MLFSVQVARCDFAIPQRAIPIYLFSVHLEWGILHSLPLRFWFASCESLCGPKFLVHAVEQPEQIRASADNPSFLREFASTVVSPALTRFWSRLRLPYVYPPL